MSEEKSAKREIKELPKLEETLQKETLIGKQNKRSFYAKSF